MQHLRLYSLLTLFLMVYAPDAGAGRLIGRKPNTVSPLYNLQLTTVRASISIDNLLAVVHVDEEFVNEEAIDLEGFYVFQLPEGALVDGLWIWIDGVRTTFVVKRLADAHLIYDSLSRKGIGDPAILESLGTNRFQLKITPIRSGSTKRVELRYFHTIPMNIEGLADFYYPISHKSYQSEPIHEVDISIDISTGYPVLNLATNYDSFPSMITQTKITDEHFSLSFGADDVVYTDDLHVTFNLEGWQMDLPWLDYAISDTADEGYFMMWCPMTSPGQEAVPTDFVIALDASGSMIGLRNETSKLTVADILSRMKSYDRFRIVLFSDNAVSFPADTSMLFASAANINSAINYLTTDYLPEGMTNYRSCFIKGTMTTSFRETAIRRFIMITDGLPNVDGRTSDELTNYISDVQFLPVTIFSEKLNLLDSLAKDHSGFVTTLEQGDDIQNVITRLAFMFSSGFFADVIVHTPQSTKHVLPDTLPSTSFGNDIIIAGRFDEAGPVQFNLSFTANGLPVSKSRAAELIKHDTYPLQVAKYWGAQRIQGYLRELRHSPDNPELIESVVRLSEYFNILSPYTAFLVYKQDEIIIVTDVEDGLQYGTIPSACHLFQNYPNPFNPSTTVSYYVPDASFSRSTLMLRIYDVTGKLVKTLLEGTAEPGYHSVIWDGTNDRGNPVSSGVYICEMKVGATVQSIRMILVR